MIEEYLQAKKVGVRHAGRSASARTLAAYRTALCKAEQLVGRPLQEFDEQSAETLLVNMDGLASSTRAGILAACRGYFDWAIGSGRYKGTHPFAGIKSPRVSRVLPTILLKEELECFFKAFKSAKYRLFFETMYYGGLRISEVAGLKREHIVEGGIVVLGKGNKERFVPLPKYLRRRLREYAAEHTDSVYVFYSDAYHQKRDQPISLTQARKEFAKAREICDLPADLHPHNLRHTSATHLYAATGDIAITQKFLGHANPATTMLYAQINNRQMKDAHVRAFGE